jgi:4-amino-4-deoxy-L-arabinose transferase-like glycosyltransferase
MNGVAAGECTVRVGRWQQAVDFVQRHRAVLAVIGVGLVCRLGLLLYYLSTHGWQGEAWETEVIAQRLMEGKGLTMPSYGGRPSVSFSDPIFPVLSYLLHLIWGPGLGLFYALHLAVAGLVLWLTYLLGSHVFDHRTGLLATLLVAVEPGLVIYQSYKVDHNALTMLLMLLAALLILLVARTGDRRPAFSCGLVIGIAVLMRPDELSLFGMLAVWAWIERRNLATIVKPAAVILAGAAMILIPWMVRNSILHGQPVFITTYSGEALWRGNNPNSTGTGLTLDGRPQFSAAPVEFQKQTAEATEVGQNALFKEEAWRYIRQDPAGFLVRCLKKLYYFWWFTPTYAAIHYEWVPGSLVVAYKALYGVLLAFAMLGLWLALRRIGDAYTWIVLSIPMWMALLHSISYVEGRHRVMVMPIILIVTASGMLTLMRVFLARWRPIEKGRIGRVASLP